MIGANCVIGHDSVIAAGADIESSVLWDHVDVGAGARVKEAIVGTRAQIRADAFIAEGVVIGDYAKIGESSTVKANAKVWPYKEVEDGATLGWPPSPSTSTWPPSGPPWASGAP